MENHKNRLSIRQKRIFVFIGLALFILLTVLVAVKIGRPMIRFIDDHEKFRAWVDENGLSAKLGFIGMIVLQVIIAIIPGEPLELAAGYAFGAVMGTVLCIIGITLGSVIVFLAVRRFGMKIVCLFFDDEKIGKLKFLHYSKRRNLWIFIIFFIPGTPKDVLCYFVGLTDIHLSHWVLITSIARLPSVITSTIVAHSAGMQNYTTAVVMLIVTVAISLVGMLFYRMVIKTKNKTEH